MVSDMEKARPNNRILVSRDRNCSGIIVNNISGHVSHQCGV